MKDSLNHVHLIGKVGTSLNSVIWNEQKHRKLIFSLVTKTDILIDTGEKQNIHVWHNITAWDDLADYVHEEIHQNDIVEIIGQAYQREYTDQNGNNRYITEIICSSVKLIKTIVK